MEPIIYKPGAYKSPGIYNGAGDIYKGRGVYKDGATPPPGKVIFGGIEYEFVKINNLYWIKNSLKNLTTDYFETPFGRDVGLLYPVTVYSEINALLHDGWRIPLKIDFDDLLGGGSPNSKEYISEIEGGTNETGFSGRLIGYVNRNGVYNNNSVGYVWSNTKYDYNAHYYNLVFNISFINDINYSSKTISKLQIRLCKDT